MEREIKETINKMSTEELLEVVSENPDDYTEEAITYIIEVLRQRVVPLAEIEKRKMIYKQKIIELKHQEEKSRKEKKWVKVKNFPSRLFAEQAKEILENNGITSIIKGEDIVIFGPGPGFGTGLPEGVSLWVFEDDYQDTRTLIETFFDDI